MALSGPTAPFGSGSVLEGRGLDTAVHEVDVGGADVVGNVDGCNVDVVDGRSWVTALSSFDTELRVEESVVLILAPSAVFGTPLDAVVSDLVFSSASSNFCLSYNNFYQNRKNFNKYQLIPDIQSNSLNQNPVNQNFRK